MKIQFIGNNANSINASYKVPFQNLSIAFESSGTTSEDVAGKELLFESCMVANGWNKMKVSAVALTEPAFAIIGSRKDPL